MTQMKLEQDIEAVELECMQLHRNVMLAEGALKFAQVRRHELHRQYAVTVKFKDAG